MERATIHDGAEQRTDQALRETEEQYRAIFEASGDGLMIRDLDEVVVDANPAMCRMHGYTREEFVGLRLRDFIHPESYRQLVAERRQVQQGGSYFARARHVRKDGSTFFIEAHGSPITYRGRPHVLGVVRDITERVEARQALERRVEERTRELATLLDISRNVASTLELDALLGLLLGQLEAVTPFAGAAVFVLDGADELRLLRYRGPLPQDRLRQRWPLAQAAHNAAVIRTGQPVIIPDVRQDTPLARAFRAKAVADLGTVPEDIASWMGVPLMLQGRVTGMLAFDHGAPNAFSSHHAELALAAAGQAAVAIENARLYERAQAAAALEERQKLARELHDSVSQALYGIALGARTARAQLDRDPAKAAEPLDYVLSLAQAGLAEMRALIFELRPESLATEGLAAALTKQAESLRARHGLAVTAELEPEPEAPLPAKEALYRIAQEALHNVVKHARATEVALTIHQEGPSLVLEVADNGAGFDPEAAYPGHLGLRSMSERAAQVGGTLRIDSAPGRGAHLKAAIPIGD